jgi:hypothetical protein
MSVQTVTHEVSRCPEGVSSLGVSRAAMSEVQICGIPKLSSWEVASTP